MQESRKQKGRRTLKGCGKSRRIRGVAEAQQVPAGEQRRKGDQAEEEKREQDEAGDCGSGGQQKQHEGQDEREGDHRCPDPPLPVRDHQVSAASIACSFDRYYLGCSAHLVILLACSQTR